MELVIKRIEFDPDTGDIMKVKEKLVERTGEWVLLAMANPNHWRVREKEEQGYIYRIYYGGLFEGSKYVFSSGDIFQIGFMRWVLQLTPGDSPKQAQEKWTKQFRELVKSSKKP